MHIVFITPASALRRFPVYRLGSRFYGHPNAITGPLILGGILKKAGHTAEVYEELNGKVPPEKMSGKGGCLQSVYHDLHSAQSLRAGRYHSRQHPMQKSLSAVFIAL